MAKRKKSSEGAVENHVSPEILQDGLQRMRELEDQAQSIMMKAMKECKDGPRKEQKELREELKQQGVRGKVFSALWQAEKAQRQASKVVNALEENDEEQLTECIQAFGEDSPFGRYLQDLRSADPFASSDKEDPLDE